MPGRGKYWKKDGLKNETVTLADTTAGFADIRREDDFFYDAEPTAEYDTEGTWAAVTGSGGQCKWTTGTTAGDRARVGSAANGKIDPTKRFLIRARTGLTTADEELFHYVGAFGALPTAADPPVLDNEGIFFRLVETTTNANWFAVCRSGGTETTVDTGVVCATGLKNFEISRDTGSASIIFKIDGTQVGAIATNIPTAVLIPAIVEVTGDTAAKAILVDSLVIENSRS